MAENRPSVKRTWIIKAYIQSTRMRTVGARKGQIYSSLDVALPYNVPSSDYRMHQPTHLQVDVVRATIPGVGNVSTIHDLSKNIPQIIPRYLRVVIEV